MGDIGGVRSDDALVRTDETGRIADRMMFEHTARFERRWYTITDGVWCLVGNGLSNQSFVRGPEGIVAIDTGESIEEMNAALAELRRVTDEPVVAVLYTHFHYVGGTAAITAVEPVTEIHGHARIAENLTRSATEIAPTYGRGLVEQFGIQLPPESADGLVGVGLGRSYREPDHAPFTPGHVPATHVFDGSCTLHVAGLEVHVEPAPSDADDSVTYWFPSLGVAVHNLVWPTLFNVFAIRGETYRDPQVLLTGLDHLRSLGAEHLVATHGPPMSGAGDIARRVTAYRDSIQFLWDQTVRWTNRGASGAELAHRIRLPDAFGDDWITQQHYGLVEHHVRQIRSGLFGFFDGDPINLLPLDRSEHADRTVAAMGGSDAVRAACRAALQPSTDGSDGDLRWAVHLAALAADRSDADDSDRELLASALRTVARRVTAANIRNWCLTRARQLDGSLDMSRHNSHGFGRRQVEAWSLDRAVSVLRVLVDPDLLDGVDVHVAVECGQERSGLHVRNHVACPTDGVGATSVVRCERAVWNSLLTASTTLDEAIAAGTIVVDPPARRALSALDHPAFR
ncbi:MAG: alkyl sulfatase dimerization domain-containing protein [Ilumatobacteraceae bacterium]